jgi:hypothetical protein
MGRGERECSTNNPKRTNPVDIENGCASDLQPPDLSPRKADKN